MTVSCGPFDVLARLPLLSVEMFDSKEQIQAIVSFLEEKYTTFKVS